MMQSILNTIENKEESEENVDPSIEANNKLLYGNVLDSIDIIDLDKLGPKINKLGTYKPIKTRINMSKYEFAGVITKLACYLNTLDDLDKFVENTKINGFVNNTELAYHLLVSGKFNALINRLGYEVVSFSELKINPVWKSCLENYFKRNHEALENKCYKYYNDIIANGELDNIIKMHQIV